MTFLGKLLVFVNAVLSFLMLAWAVGVATNRVDWSNTQAKGDKPAGQLNARAERVKNAWASLGTAEYRWGSARTKLAGVEKNLVAARKVYDDELKGARVGPGGDRKATINTIKPDANGIPDIDPNTGLPVMEPGKDRYGQALHGNEFYFERLKQLAKDIDAEQVRYQDLIRQTTAETEKAIGPKGLRQRIVDEQIKNARVAEELVDLSGRKTNSLVETELLLSRREQLEQRIEELKKAKGDKE
jgi:hypothetical protein